MAPETSSHFINRELSWLSFNQRVLDQALDASFPLLERLKFLCIVSSNLDEFFMVRVGGLRIREEAHLASEDPAGLSCTEQLEAITATVRRMVASQYGCLSRTLLPGLAKAGIRLLPADRLQDADAAFAERHFREEIFPLITPMAIEEGMTLPLFMPLRLYAAVRLAPPAGSKKERLAVLPFSANIARMAVLHAGKEFRFVLAEDLIRHFVERFFLGEKVLECGFFRITRNADLSLGEDKSADLLKGMEEILQARKRSDCIRLEIESRASGRLTKALENLFEVNAREIYPIPGPLQLQSFHQIAGLEGFDRIRLSIHRPQPQPGIDMKRPIFETLMKGPILLHHPYEQFDPVVKLIEDASRDPDVLAIKQILYRTSRESPVVAALGEAAARGKQVTAVVELKARFDEERNIDWARKLEESGAQIIYGIKGLKTHAKLCIVLRREARGLIRYLHFGTGNYNEITARLYSDISYMTCDEALGAEAMEFFNAITGYSQPPTFTKIAAAPLGLKEKLIELIDGEAERRRQGDKKARIIAKMNALVDKDVIKALYRASSAGVRIQLNVRGVCCLRPGVRGLSENISVISIVDRFLEHSRIFNFRHGGADLLYISSADWMPRNLERRIELMVPVEDSSCRTRLMKILESFFQDNVKGRRLMADGRYTVPKKKAGQKSFRAQNAFIAEAQKAVDVVEKTRRTVFEPLRPNR